MADDMGFSDIGCYGGEVATPNLDRLAARGVRFTQFYNAARCCPTRASLLTGLYPHQAGIGHMVENRGLPGYRGDLNGQCVTIAQVLRSAGYRTCLAGKWHVTPWNADSRHNWPLQRGFEKFYGTIRGGGSYYQPYKLVRDNDVIEPEGDGYYYTDALGQHAVGYVNELTAGSDPFFLYLAFTAPHWPMHAPSSEVAKYTSRYLDGWDKLRGERHARMIRMGIVDRKWRRSERDPAVNAWSGAPHKEWEARRMAVYAAMIDRMDQAIGQVLQAIRAAGQEDNTLVLFLADNGGCAESIATQYSDRIAPRTTLDGRPTQIGDVPGVMPGGDDTFQAYGRGWANASNTPFRMFKHWVHEGGISTPLIVSWPEAMKKRGGITHQPGHIIDVMATCLDAAGCEYPRTFGGQTLVPTEGRSLLPVVRGGSRKPHPMLFWEHEGNRAVRRGNWKLVAQDQHDWELYDLQSDRTETMNVAGRHVEIVAELSRAYDEWAKRCHVEPWARIVARKPEALK